MRRSGVSFPVNGADRNEPRDTEGPSTDMGVHDSRRREERGFDPSANINAGNNNGDRNEPRNHMGGLPVEFFSVPSIRKQNKNK